MEREVEGTPIGVPIFEVLEKVSPSVVATIPTLDIPTPPSQTPPPKDLLDKGLNDSQHPLYMRLRNRISWWEKYATPQVVHLITHGLPACWVKSLPRPSKVLNRPFQEVKDALEIMDKYLSMHAVRELHQPPSHLIPWFLVYKPKPRFISNCVQINICLQPLPYFRLQKWNAIFPYLVQGRWAIKIDLKHAYFHLALCPELQRLFNFQIGSRFFQCRSACFGLHYIPYSWTQVMKTFLRKWRKAGMVVFIYLDDIIVLGPSKERLYVHRCTVLKDLVASGLTINFITSLLSPTQQFEALELQVNLKDGYLMVPMHKRKGYRKEAGKLLTNVHMTPRKMAAILGCFRSLLPALPALRAFTDVLVTFVAKHRMVGWDTACPIPFNLKEQVRSMKKPSFKLARSPFFRQSASTHSRAGFRFNPVCLGRPRHTVKGSCTRFLETRQVSYESQGASSIHSHNHVFCTAKQPRSIWTSTIQ